MSTYRFGDQKVRRKNLYRPCVMVDAFDKAEADGDEAELARLFTITNWCDVITGAEWRAVLQEPGCSPSAKSRLKAKAAGWLLALWHVAEIHPEFFEEIVAKAETIRVDQHQKDPVVLLVWDGALFVGRKPTLVGAPVNWHPHDDTEEPAP